MRYVNLGNTGLRVSRVCLGMMSLGHGEERPWALTEEDAEPIVRRAVEGGITFFDTADVYNGGQSEVVTGHVLPKLLTREEMVVATKVCMPFAIAPRSRPLPSGRVTVPAEPSTTIRRQPPPPRGRATRAAAPFSISSNERS